MAKIIKEKVPKKYVKDWEQLLGFKTTGKIEIHHWDRRTQKKIDKILEELYLPKEVK